LSANFMANYTQIIVSDSSSSDKKQSLDVTEGSKKWQVTDFSSKIKIIMSEMGWGGLPKHLIKEELGRGDLKRLEISSFPTRISKIYLMKKREKSSGAVMTYLWNNLKK